MRSDVGDRHAHEDEPSAVRAEGDRLRLIAHRRARIAPTLVLVSLVLLAILPVLESYWLQRLWRELTTVIEPARALVSRMQAALALEVAGTRGYLITGEPRFAESFARARESRRSAEARLLPLARRIDPAIATQVEEMTRRFRAADAVLDSLYAGRMTRQRYVTRIDAQQTRFQALVDAAAALDSSVGRVSDATRAQIRRTGLASAALTLGLVLLGVTAAAQVARLAEALTESEVRFRQTAENINDLIWLADPGLRRFLFVNAAYGRIWGRSARSLYERPESWLDAVHPDDRARVRAAVADAEREGAFGIEFRVVRPDGEIRWVWSRGFAVRNDRGVPYRIAGITEDITERKAHENERDRLLRSEREAREASEAEHAVAERGRQELERVTRSRARLIRGFTHDVKNPLGAADGSLALLEDGILGELSPEQLESVRRGRRSIQAALGLIDHLLELARAEAGQVEVRREAMDVCATAREVTEEFRAQAETKGLVLAVDLPDSVTPIRSDPARARQILSNLVSNAVKYTPAGGRVLVRVRCGTEGGESGAWVAVDVTDTGPGIAHEAQAMLFKEFTRFDPGAAHGTGIGLAISQRLARALGGEIRVQSALGAGSTFTLWLPANAP